MYDDTDLQIIEYHRSLLDDRVRTGSFLRAILKAVKPGDVVLDMGCGTGVLSYFACMAGAKRVYAVEQDPIIELAREICKKNGYQDQVVFLNDWSTNVDLPEAVDVIITETVGNLGFEEGILGWIIDAKKRFLVTGGQIIPHAIELCLVPTANLDYHASINTWNQDFYSLDFSPGRSLAVNNLSRAELEPNLFLSEPAPLVSIKMDEVDSADLSGELTFVANQEGLIHGLGGWFTAELIPGLEVSNAPPNKAPSWNQVFFPFDRPVPASPGDRLHVAVQVRDNSEHWDWNISTTDPNNGDGSHQQAFRLEHHSGAGKLTSNSHQLSPEFKPQRTEEAEIDLSILQMMDGTTALGDIARQVLVKFPTYFSSYERALDYAVRFSEDYAHWKNNGRFR